MDLNLLRSIATLLMFVLFIGICLWAWSRKRQAGFAEAAAVPLIDDEAPAKPQSGEHS